MSNWNVAIESALQARRESHGFRSRRELRLLDATHVQLDGKRLINFASNNYLGLTHHPRVVEAFASCVRSSGAGSGAAALVSGYTTVHASAERAIAAWKRTEAAVLVGSGYAANLAAVQALAAIAGKNGIRFLLDKLCHASLIDAVSASGAPLRIFPHNGLKKLRRLLEDAETNQLQVVATESIFSMDGDSADLEGLAQLKASHPFLLLLDEAHGTGVYGPNGSGYAAERGLQAIVDISVITLSKAVGVYGGAICASNAFCDAVVNFGRSYIYSTNLPAAVAAAIEAAIDVIRTEPQRQRRVREFAQLVRAGLRKAGLELLPGNSPIIPVVLGDESKALEASADFQKNGMLVVAIRPPTVARGSSRLRITLSSEHTPDELERLISALEVYAGDGSIMGRRGC